MRPAPPRSRTASRLRAFRAGLAVGILTLSACTRATAEGAVRGGPLDAGGTPGTYCGRAGTSTDITFSGDVVRNKTDKLATVDSIDLVRPAGLRIVEAFLVPVDHNLIGTALQWPPPTAWLAAPGVQWSARTPADGASIGAHSVRNIVLHVRKADGLSSFSVDAVRVNYHVGRTNYYTDTSTRSVLAARC
jgi:hypothetical protein